MFDGVASWWDGFELWLAQQWFPIQFVLVTAVLVPLCVFLAWLIHRTVDVVADLVGRIGGRGHRPGGSHGSGGSDDRSEGRQSALP